MSMSMWRVEYHDLKANTPVDIFVKGQTMQEAFKAAQAAADAVSPDLLFIVKPAERIAHEDAMARYERTDSDNMRVYYRRAKAMGGGLACFQATDASGGDFRLYACTPDGEPSHAIRVPHNDFLEIPGGGTKIDDLLLDWLGARNA